MHLGQCVIDNCVLKSKVQHWGNSGTLVYAGESSTRYEVEALLETV
jgi:hypothetical protein